MLRGVPFLLPALALSCASPPSSGLSGSSRQTPNHEQPPPAGQTLLFVRTSTETPVETTVAAPERAESASIGRPNRGALHNGLQMTDGPSWVVQNPERAWATDETIASIVAAVGAVNKAFPDSPKIYVGDISAEHGGYIRPHHSHQSGRDVDLGLYYTKGPAWFVRARADNLDRPRSWAILKALIADPNVEVIFVDRSIQRLLKDYAVTLGETRERLDALFDERTAFSDRLIRHEWGHLTHFHVRFKCPKAVEAGERSHRELALAHRIPNVKYY